jgi:hypothetical protein
MDQKQKIYAFFMVVILLLIYYLYTKNKSSTTSSPVTTTTPKQTQPIMPTQPGSNTGIVAPTPPSGPSVKKTIYDTSGTTYADTVLELYPELNYGGYDSNGQNAVKGINIMDTSLSKSDVNGKYVTFMSQRNGTANWILNSLKAAPGTILEFLSHNSGNTNRAFMIVGYNIPNLQQVFINYPVLAGDQGVFMFNWMFLDMDFQVRVIDQDTFTKEKQNKYNDCYNMATTGWGYDDTKASGYCTLPDIIGGLK